MNRATRLIPQVKVFNTIRQACNFEKQKFSFFFTYIIPTWKLQQWCANVRYGIYNRRLVPRTLIFFFSQFFFSPICIFSTLFIRENLKYLTLRPTDKPASYVSFLILCSALYICLLYKSRFSFIPSLLKMRQPYEGN